MRDLASNSDWMASFAAAVPRIVAYVRHAARTSHDVADLLAEVRAHAWEHRDHLILSEDPHRELLLVARAVCRDWVRTRRRERSIVYDVCDACDLGDSDAVPAWLAIDTERLTSAMESLSPNQRLAVERRHRDAWPYEKIAAALDCEVATARVHVMRGLRALRQKLCGAANTGPAAHRETSSHGLRQWTPE